MKKSVMIMAVLLCLIPMVQGQKGGSAKRVKNVIYVVGDGMGTAQVYSSIVEKKGESQFVRFPFTGFSRTYSWDKYTTDSGAGGSALMTGHKVENRHIAESPEGDAFKSVLVQAAEKGRKAGFVVTSSVLDATPASTYAHVPYRKMYDTISMQMALAPFDVMIGGDRGHFDPANRKDGKAPLDTLRNRGYRIVESLDDLATVSSGKVVGLLSEGDPGKAWEREGMLCKGVRTALNILGQSKKGFVLMVEGSQIDWACHNNDAEYLSYEMDDFEQMLQVVLNWAAKDGNTLVVVTADHETGGLTLPDGDIDKGENVCKWQTGSHTGVMVPVFAFGPGAEQFSGIHQNIEIATLLRKALGL